MHPQQRPWLNWATQLFITGHIKVLPRDEVHARHVLSEEGFKQLPPSYWPREMIEL